ncbi:Glycosyl transferase family 2 [Tardiphaga sp. OK246]|uniref:glycosyltransferase n=1 Tax=Tardiphaga sp. OK246 TaxID=1855307 RepID=UPI000B75AD1B|nr:glycosyltransferase [Tardiphaga sp. OK246]SNT63933.1 Glycosyl transferase family 2 [Tardiphaga sp. OK246]
MSTTPMFTVVIPTLNRAQTLQSAIQTCTMQDDNHLSIIVSDNMSDDDTFEVVSKFNDPRIRYVKPDIRLGMSEHWEFALSHVQDGFVTFLGDDDALLPGAIAQARQLLTKTNAKALTWQKIEYCWPDHIIPEYRNWLYLPIAQNIQKLNSVKTVKQVLDFRAPYNRLPCIYNSFVHLNEIRSFQQRNNGIFFGAMSPDIYSAFAIADTIEEFCYSDAPLSINGASSKSNGTLHTQGSKESEVVKQFYSDTKFKYESDVPMGRVIEFAVLDAFYKVQRNSSTFARTWVDKTRVLESAISSAFASVRSNEVRADWLNTIRAFSDAANLTNEYDTLLAQSNDLSHCRDVMSPGLYSSVLVFNATTLGIRNVRDCALRCAEILDFKDHNPKLFDRLASSKTPLIAISLYARAGKRPVRLHLGCGYAYFEDYVNVDYPQSEHSVMTVTPDVACDINEIDLPDSTVDEIRLQHVFEHFNRAVAIGSIVKWQRWLRPGGKLHIETPDFEASAQDFLEADSLEQKMRAIRHLEGDQADAWAYHVGQWFPSRFRKTFEILGFKDVEIRQEASGHKPPLFNVIAIGYKSDIRSLDQQFEAGSILLRDLMVAEEEHATWVVWRGQLASVLGFEAPPQPSIGHPHAAPNRNTIDSGPIAEEGLSIRAIMRRHKAKVRKLLILASTIVVVALTLPLLIFLAIGGFLLSIGFLFATIWAICEYLVRRMNYWRLGVQPPPPLRDILKEVPFFSSVARRLKDTSLLVS